MGEKRFFLLPIFDQGFAAKNFKCGLLSSFDSAGPPQFGRANHFFRESTSLLHVPAADRCTARLPFPRRVRGDSKPIYVKRLLAVPTHRALGLCWSRCPCDDGAKQIRRSRRSQEAQNPSVGVGRRECYTGGALVLHISLLAACTYRSRQGLIRGAMAGPVAWPCGSRMTDSEDLYRSSG